MVAAGRHATSVHAVHGGGVTYACDMGRAASPTIAVDTAGMAIGGGDGSGSACAGVGVSDGGCGGCGGGVVCGCGRGEDTYRPWLIPPPSITRT